MNQLTRAVEGPLLVVAVIAARGYDVGVVLREVAVAVHVQAIAILSVHYGASCNEQDNFMQLFIPTP